MSIIDRISEVADQKGFKQNDICAVLDITSGTYSTWKKVAWSIGVLYPHRKGNGQNKIYSGA